MKKKVKHLQVVAVLMMGLETCKLLSAAVQIGGTMEGMTVAEAMKVVVEVGITPALLLIFVVFFLRKSNEDDAKVKEAYENAQETLSSNNKAVRDREDYLISESMKREDIIRQEAEKREKLIRQEAEKRENILMVSQDRMLDSLDSIAKSLARMEGAFCKMEASFAKMENRMDKIERKVSEGNGCNESGRSEGSAR